MPRPKGSGHSINTVRKVLADGTIKVYFYNRVTKESFAVDPRLPDNPRTAAEESVRPGSVGDLIQQYKRAPDYKQLAVRTRDQYAKYLDQIKNIWNDVPVRSIERRHVFALRDTYADHPRTANFYVQVLRLLLAFGVDRGFARQNVALRPKLLRTGEGYRPWEEHEIASFRSTWSPETRERVLFELLVNTGQRTVDVIAMQRGHIRATPDGPEISVRQQKTGVRVWVPLSTELEAVLTPWLKTHTSLMLIPSEVTTGALSVSGLRQIMRPAYVEAGLPKDCVNHGLRYTAAVRLSELGCDWETIATITGHETVTMVRKYLAKRRQARIAINKLDRRKP
jgi:integrase